jgi:hypothetical protein
MSTRPHNLPDDWAITDTSLRRDFEFADFSGPLHTWLTMGSGLSTTDADHREAAVGESRQGQERDRR